MFQPRRIWSAALILSLLFLLSTALAAAQAGEDSGWTPLIVEDDPLVRMPGTQPHEVQLESSKRCLNCHGNYNPEVEPGFNWEGSMMAQAARDFLFWPTLVVAGQDSLWATGTPNAVDICERCHFPEGWLEGRSDPPNVSAMKRSDYDGVSCDFCHTMYDPFFETTYAGTREGDDWVGYWDETNASDTPSQPAADATYTEDAALAAMVEFFNGDKFFTDNLPPEGYTENGSGQYFVSPDSQKRGPFADSGARHRTLYSRYHKSKYFCNSCHDVSNPVLANLGQDGAEPLTTETDPAYSYYHVERTFSEFMLSAYGQQGGAPTNPEFQAQGAPDITQAATCQDCHMRDVTGAAADTTSAVIRPDESVEHPNSGLPLHDLTGGNAWVSWVLASAVPGSPNYDEINEALLDQGKKALTLDLGAGLGLNPDALLAGAERAKQQLLLAATVKNVSYNADSGDLSFRVQNNTGHKLASGYPEGRRVFVNIRAYDADGNVIYEVNPYDADAGTLKGLESYIYADPDGALPEPASLSDTEAYVDELVYEAHTKSELTGEEQTFHFALATGRRKDNRIPPKGFDVDTEDRPDNAEARLVMPVYYVTDENGEKVDVGKDYFTAEEYAGGYDDVSLMIPAGAARVEVNVYYQTTSREYIEFLRNEINGTGNLTLSSPAPSGLPEAYVIQSDPFFGQLAAWGDTIWQLWTHNKDVPGAAPFLMAQAAWDAAGAPAPACNAPTPTLSAATAANREVTLAWTVEPADSDIASYKVYYDQAGKAQFVADAGPATEYTDTGLTNGQSYCYKVTATYADGCESAYSETLCARPQRAGQETDPAGALILVSGVYSGTGEARVFADTGAFAAGDPVVFRALIIDQATGWPLSGATAEIEVMGPATATLNTEPSSVAGLAEVEWRPDKPGEYTAQVAGIAADGYHWDGAPASTRFTVR